MQKARGASLKPSDRNPTGFGSRPWLLFVAVATTGYAVDVSSKNLAVAELAGRGYVPLLGDLFGLRLAFNPGAAFSTGTGLTEFITCFAILAVGVVLFVARRLGSRPWAWGLGLLLAGIAGNLTDRLFRDPGPFRGHVVDFFQLPHWPIFNVADICIDTGAAIVLVMAFRGIAVDGRRESAEDAADTVTGEPGSVS